MFRVALHDGKCLRTAEVRLGVDDGFASLRLDVETGRRQIHPPCLQRRNHRSVHDDLRLQLRDAELLQYRSGHLGRCAGHVSIGPDVAVWRLVGHRNRGIALCPQPLQRGFGQHLNRRDRERKRKQCNQRQVFRHVFLLVREASSHVAGNCFKLMRSLLLRLRTASRELAPADRRQSMETMNFFRKPLVRSSWG